MYRPLCRKDKMLASQQHILSERQQIDIWLHAAPRTSLDMLESPTKLVFLLLQAKMTDLNTSSSTRRMSLTSNFLLLVQKIMVGEYHYQLMRQLGVSIQKTVNFPHCGKREICHLLQKRKTFMSKIFVSCINHQIQPCQDHVKLAEKERVTDSFRKHEGEGKQRWLC